MGKQTTLFSKRLIFFTGKGGVGKTTLIAYYAQLLAKQGKKVCIVEHQSLGEFESILGLQKKDAPDISKAISLLEFDTQSNVQKFFEHHVAKTFLAKIFFQNQIIKSFLNSIPGLGELSFLGRLANYVESYKKIDVFLVDGFSSGHFYSLMKTPRALLSFGMNGLLLKKISEAQKILEDRSQTATVFITNPERVVLEETTDFISDLEENTHVHIDQLILNRFWEQTNLDEVPILAAVRQTLQKKQSDSKFFADKLAVIFPDKEVIHLPENSYFEEFEFSLQQEGV